jgi:hypothetical protein
LALNTSSTSVTSLTSSTHPMAESLLSLIPHGNPPLPDLIAQAKWRIV